MKQNFVFKYLWLFMAIHILNFSIDSPDAKPDSIAEDLRVNDIESFSELIIEQILGFENSISEHDEPDTEEGLSFEVNKIILICGTSYFIQVSPQINPPPTLESVPFSNEWLFSQFTPSIVSPPPKKSV